MARSQTYQTAQSNEFCLCFGDSAAENRILIIPPLFDEMNRMRRVLISAMRILAENGIASALPDLPGCNESQLELRTQNLSSWRNEMRNTAAAFSITHIASIRGGALIDGICEDLPHWRLAPVKGDSLLKSMLRTRIAGDKEAGLNTTSDALIMQAQTDDIELAGNILGPQMIADLAISVPAELENLQLRTLGDGPDMITGKALWLRAEPQDDPEFAAAIAQDIAQWSSLCAA
jgi:hypothetical protein